jgi:hypothetical protein
MAATASHPDSDFRMTVHEIVPPPNDHFNLD